MLRRVVLKQLLTASLSLGSGFGGTTKLYSIDKTYRTRAMLGDGTPSYSQVVGCGRGREGEGGGGVCRSVRVYLKKYLCADCSYFHMFRAEFL